MAYSNFKTTISVSSCFEFDT